MQVIRCQDWQTCHRNKKYVGIRRPKVDEFGTTLITGKNSPLTNYELESKFWYKLNNLQIFQNVPIFKREEFLKSDTSVYLTQLFYQFQHYNPVILLDVNITSSCLRPQQSEFITCCQYTNISLHKLSAWFLRQEENNIPASCRIAWYRRNGGKWYLFFMCVQRKFQCVLFMAAFIWQLACNRPKRDERIFSYLTVIWFKKYIGKF